MLVNTPASKDKDLTQCGEVCRAFCTVGGKKMQKVCNLLECSHAQFSIESSLIMAQWSGSTISDHAVREAR